MRRFVTIAILVVSAAGWTVSAAAAPPVRTVTFETTQAFTSPFCGDAVIVEDDVGRITFTEFASNDGAPRPPARSEKGAATQKAPSRIISCRSVPLASEPHDRDGT